VNLPTGIRKFGNRARVILFVANCPTMNRAIGVASLFLVQVKRMGMGIGNLPWKGQYMDRRGTKKKVGGKWIMISFITRTLCQV
jgi:hypothetical protein